MGSGGDGLEAPKKVEREERKKREVEEAVLGQNFISRRNKQVTRDLIAGNKLV